MSVRSPFFEYIYPRIKKLIEDKIYADKLDFNGEIYTWDDFKFSLKGNNYCVYQTESLNLLHKLTPAYIQFLNKAKYVFDYSELNIPYYPRAIYLPLKIEKIPPKNNVLNKEILFYGYISDRRKNIIELLKNNSFLVKTIDGCFGDNLYNTLSKYQYVLSYGTYDNVSNDSFRIIPAIENGCIVLTERTQEKSFDEYLLKKCSDRIIFFEETTIIDDLMQK